MRKHIKRKLALFLGLTSLLASCTLNFGGEQSFSFAKPYSSISLIDQDELESRSREESLSRENDPGVDYSDRLLSSNLAKSDLTCKTASKGKSGTNYAQMSKSVHSAKQVADGIGDHVMDSIGEKRILVIPVIIKDYQDNVTETNRELIYKTFFGKSSDTSWESVSSYYYKSSFGNLLINGTVSEWFDYGKTASELSHLTSQDVYGQNIGNFDPTLDVLDKAVEWYKKRYHTDCKEFDADNDGRIDGVWLVYSAPTYQNNYQLGSSFWAYTFSKYQGTLNEESPNPFRYCWGSVEFLKKAYGATGCDAHTYIHETGHMMGLDDYYDVNGRVSACGGVDMMDNNIADHNTFSKYGLGWTRPYLVSGDCEIDLKPASTSGESIIIPTEGGFSNSAFDEYILVELYTPDELNAKDAASTGGYYGPYLRAFTNPGVKIYHIDARLATSKLRLNQWGTWSYTTEFVQSYTQITTKAHTNSPSTGTQSGYSNRLNDQYRLIQMIDKEGRNFSTSMRFASNNSLFKSGDSFSYDKFSSQFANKTTMNNGSKFAYSVSFSDLSASGVKVTITKG